MAKGLLSHLDFSVGEPGASIRFYDALLTQLGYTRWRSTDKNRQEPNPSRAAWGVKYADGTTFGIDLRPAATNAERKYDRCEPGPHHLAFSVDTDEEVDVVYQSMLGVNAVVADKPCNYGGQVGYGDHYYAVFFFDPDGFKVEVVHAQGFEV